MSGPSNAVFISYRREASWTLVQAIYQRLTEAGIDAFYDIESLRAGEFERVILNQIRARPYFLLVLTPGTLERCSETEDWLRKEIETAVAAARIIVPLHTPTFELSSVKRLLPGALGGKIAGYQALEVPHKYFKFAMQQLIEDYLVPVALETAETPLEDQARVASVKQIAATAPKVTQKQLTAQELLERAQTDSRSTTRDYFLTAIRQLGYRHGSPYLNETSKNIYYADEVDHKKPRIVLRGGRIRIEEPERSGVGHAWTLWKSFSLENEVDTALETINRMKGRPSRKP